MLVEIKNKKGKIKEERIKTPRRQAEERKGDPVGNVDGVVSTVGRMLRNPLSRVRDRSSCSWNEGWTVALVERGRVPRFSRRDGLESP